MAFTLKILTFEEYLQRMDEQGTLEIYREVPFPNYAFDKLLAHFHAYCLIGGIPEAVTGYQKQGDIRSIQPIYEKTLNELFSKTSHLAHTKKTRDRLVTLYQDAFMFASTRISFRSFSRSENKSRDVGDAFRRLETAGLVKLIYPTTHTSLPWQIDRNRSPRLHLPDTGLVNYFSGIQEALIHPADLSAIFNRQISLHVVGQELLSGSLHENTEISFWVRPKTQSTAEVDFVIEHQGLMIPVEVKPGEPGRLRSLHQFIDVAPHPYAVRLHAGPLEVRQARTIRGTTYFLLSLPYFLAGKIREHLEGFIRFVNWG